MAIMYFTNLAPVRPTIPPAFDYELDPAVLRLPNAIGSLHQGPSFAPPLDPDCFKRNAPLYQPISNRFAVAVEKVKTAA